MSEPSLLDTNVLLRHILGDSPDQSRRATALIQRVERGEERATLTDTVVFEAVFTLEKLYRVPRLTIRDALFPMLMLPGVVFPGKTAYQRVFDLYVNHAALSFADCYHVALVQRLNLRSIISFDRAIDRVAGITREEPV